jgi:hypothetical protein
LKAAGSELALCQNRILPISKVNFQDSGALSEMSQTGQSALGHNRHRQVRLRFNGRIDWAARRSAAIGLLFA